MGVTFFSLTRCVCLIKVMLVFVLQLLRLKGWTKCIVIAVSNKLSMVEQILAYKQVQEACTNEG